MKIVIAGGSGLLGQALAPALVKDGHEVVVLSRSAGEVQIAGVQAAAWDGKTAQGWGHIIEGAGAIINLAGANIGARPWTAARKQLIRDSRVQSGQAIVEALQAAQNPPKILLQIAGSGYYGTGDQEIREDAPAGSDFLAGISKDWEAATAPAEALGVRRVILRTGVVLTRAGGVLSPFLLQQRLFAGGPLGSGKQWISWIHIKDLVNAMRFFLTSEDAAGVFNVTAPEPVTNAAFGRTLSKLMRRPYWLPVPAFALRLLLGEMSTLVLDGQRVYPARLEEMGFSFQFPTLRQALDDLVGREK